MEEDNNEVNNNELTNETKGNEKPTAPHKDHSNEEIVAGGIIITFAKEILNTIVG